MSSTFYTKLIHLPQLSYESYTIQFTSVQFSQSCPAFCDPVNHSTPGLSVHHQLWEFTQTHVHRVDDAIQPSHPLLSPSLKSKPNPEPSANALQVYEGC